MTLVFAFLAGILSVLSPCVMPLLPLVLGAAASEHRYGPAALAAGLCFSFVALGLFLATIGFALGLDGEVFRRVAASMMVAIGIVLMVPVFQVRLATAAGPMSNWTEQRFGGFSTTGLWGQFAVGLLLGAVWSPCVGPTLGAASVLAAQGKDLPARTMLVFGVGAALPMLLLGMLSREVLMRLRDRMIGLGKGAKALLGCALVVVGVAILTGFDKSLETSLVAASPDWLTAFSTRF
jgi:cytochrome c biogenesis protein CcdA